MAIMSTRRVTANLPSDLLDAAMEVTGKGITDTLIEGLAQVQRRRFYERAIALNGKLKLDIDLEKTRGRRRH
jgi:hypothetical protein